MDHQNKQFDDEIDLEELFSVLWQRKAFIILFVFLCSLLAYTLIQQIPNTYRSSVLIMIKKSSHSSDAIQSLISGSITAADNTETELQLIQSRNLLTQVATNLDLGKHPSFQLKDKNTASEDKSNADAQLNNAINHLEKNISVQQISGTDLISISFDSQYPELSALVANSIGSTFITYKETLMEGKHKQGSLFLGSKLEEVKKGLEQAELKIVEYQNEHEFIDIKSALALATSKLTQMHNKKDALMAKIEESKILKTYIVEHKSSGDDLLSLPVFVNSTSIASHQKEIKALSQNFAQLKQRYGYKHPKYKAAEKLLKDAQGELGALIQRQINKLDKQIEIQTEQVEFFDKEIEKLSLRINQLGVIEFDYEKLKKEFDANLGLYESLVKKQNESELMQDLTDSSNTILIESAEVPRTPVKPNRKLLLVLSGMASLLFACFVVLIEFLLGNKTLKFRKLAARLGTKVIGAVPKVKRKKKQKGVLTNVDPKQNPGFVEAVRSLRTSILLDKKRSKHKVIAITSISPDDGKSTLAFQLSKCFAEVGDTLLVDADLRFPSIAKALEQDVQRPGLTNLIANSHSLEASTCKTEELNFDVVTSGHIPKNPLVFLQHVRFKKVLKEMKDKYQRVILECPPIMSVSDAFVVSKCVDSVYLVVDSTKANSNVLANALEELKLADVEVGGIILNKVKEQKGYGTNYYYNYYRNASSDA